MKGLKILVVEDNFLSAQNMIEQLTDFGYSRVFHAGDFETAVEIIEDENPELAILDIHLENSEGDGIQIAEYLKTRLDVPIIFLTALSDKETLERAKQLNPSNYLVKPYKAGQLEIAIDIALLNFSKNESDSSNEEKKELNTREFLFFSKDSSFFLKHRQRYVRVMIPDIYYIKADGASVEIYTGNDKFVVFANLSSFLKQVPHKCLQRVHRSYAVNINAVQAFNDKYLIFERNRKDVLIPYGKSYSTNILDQFRRVKAD